MKKKAQCDYCNKKFIPNRNYEYDHSVNGLQSTFCSSKCDGLAHTKQVSITCHLCGKKKFRKLSQLNRSKSGYNFCSRSCAVSFNNTQKRKSRRSKVEEALFRLLVAEFPELSFVPSDKTMLDGFEIDIAVPDLKLGIEWNGIVHFKPIYGEIRLSEIQRRDREKQKVAESKGISLIVVPDLVSTSARVKEAFVQVSKIIRSALD